jgi:hypothetical protein
MDRCVNHFKIQYIDVPVNAKDGFNYDYWYGNCWEGFKSFLLITIKK